MYTLMKPALLNSASYSSERLLTTDAVLTWSYMLIALVMRGQLVSGLEKDTGFWWSTVQYLAANLVFSVARSVPKVSRSYRTDFAPRKYLENKLQS